MLFQDIIAMSIVAKELVSKERKFWELVKKDTLKINQN